MARVPGSVARWSMLSLVAVGTPCAVAGFEPVPSSRARKTPEAASRVVRIKTAREDRLMLGTNATGGQSLRSRPRRLVGSPAMKETPVHAREGEALVWTDGA